MNPLSSDNPFASQRENGPSDYKSGWDVPSLNKTATDGIAREIIRLKGKMEPDPAFKIPVLLGPPGLGKTHLIGRTVRQLEDDAQVVFAPQVEDADRPGDHIRYHVVEALFQAKSEASTPLEVMLARLCQSSFIRYFDVLPPSVKSRHQILSHQMRVDPMAVLEITRRVKDLAPYQKLAKSIALYFPELNQEVVRTALLGWSPERDSVRSWLRGESIPEEDLLRLHLSSEPPKVKDILRAVSRILSEQGRLLVVFCDQIEGVLANGTDDAVSKFTSLLIGFAQEIPNLLVCLSCLEDKWAAFANRGFTAFTMRTQPYRLEPLSEVQALEMVRRRLAHGERRPDDVAGTWPFRDRAIMTFVNQELPGPRGLLTRCGEIYAGFLENGKVGWIESLTPTEPQPLPNLFLEEWGREIKAIQETPNRTPQILPEDRLHRSILEALTLAREGKLDAEGVAVTGLKPQSIMWAKKSRPALLVKLTTGENIVVAVTKMENGTEFLGYFGALRDIAATARTKIVLLHPDSVIRMGEKTQKQFDQAKNSGQLRTLSLLEDEQTAQRLECYLSLLDKARSKELLLGALAVSDKDCQDLALKTNVMANLGLLEAVCGCRVPEAAKGSGSADSAGADWSSQGGAGTGSRKREAGGFGASGTATADADTGSSEPSSWPERCLSTLVEKLRIWDLRVAPVGVEVGPTFARLKIQPQGKTTVSKLRNKAEDLKTHLGLETWPIIASQANFVSVDVQLPQRGIVGFQETMAGLPDADDGQPLIPLGVDVGRKPHWLNLADPSDCHLLIAGTTGSGKSELLKSMVAGLAHRLAPQQIQFLLIDPKRVTFNFAGESPYLPHPVIYDADVAAARLEECFAETERRYKMLEKNGCENIVQLKNPPARWVVIVDEFADLLADPEAKKLLGTPLKRIGAKARAAGIHLILATQRPEASIVTPLLRSNLPGRVALKVASEGDSKLILGSKEAFHLLGKGDLLWQHGAALVRLQCPLVTRQELLETLRIH